MGSPCLFSRCMLFILSVYRITREALETWHIVKHGLDWICKTRTGFVKHGFVKTRICKTRICKTWICKTWICKTRICKTRICKRWSIIFCKKWLFDCLFVYFCLSLFNLNSFTLYYFHFMLPLHIQIISLKDCLILSNISIWKFLRIIEKYEKHSLTASKYSRHQVRHSLVFKNKIPRTYI